MQFTISSVLALLAATAIAAPTPDFTPIQGDVQVGLSNDQTGANGNANVAPNGVKIPLLTAYAGTNVITYSATGTPQILVSSTSLNGQFNLLGAAGSCTFFSPAGAAITTLTENKTFAKLGNNPDMLQIVDWTDFTVSCQTW
jgi:hypothetical protein